MKQKTDIGDMVLRYANYGRPLIYKGVTYRMDSKYGIICFVNNIDECPNVVHIAEGTHAVASYGFCRCTYLEKIYLPDSLTYIGSDAFNSCITLQYVHFGTGLNKIGNFAFSYCHTLDNVNMSKCMNLHSLPKQAFAYCSSLRNVKLPVHLTSADPSAFEETPYIRNRDDRIF